VTLCNKTVSIPDADTALLQKWQEMDVASAACLTPISCYDLVCPINEVVLN